MQYKENYLKNVICRIDFTQPLVSSKKSVDDFSNLVRGVFPKKENIKSTVLFAHIDTKKDSNKVTQSEEKVTNYKFSDKNQTKILMIEPLSI